MAFCTSCGAEVNGAFCNRCGTPSGAAVAPGPIAPPSAQRKTSPVVWILIVVLGIFVLGGVAVVGTGFFFVHRLHQAGDRPGMAVARMLASMNPNLEVLNTDDGAGRITLRDRRTGKTVTMSFDDARNGRFHFSAQDENGETANMDVGGAAGKTPAWVPAYPGSSATSTFSAKGSDGNGDAGNFTFTTADAASTVLSFYQDKVKELGLKVNLATTTGSGGMIVAADDGQKRTLSVVAGAGPGGTTVNVTSGAK